MKLINTYFICVPVAFAVVIAGLIYSIYFPLGVKISAITFISSTILLLFCANWAVLFGISVVALLPLPKKWRLMKGAHHLSHSLRGAKQTYFVVTVPFIWWVVLDLSTHGFFFASGLDRIFPFSLAIFYILFLGGFLLQMKRRLVRLIRTLYIIITIGVCALFALLVYDFLTVWGPSLQYLFR